MGKRGRKWDPEFMELLPQVCSLDPTTGKLTFNTKMYASVALNIGWKGGVLPVPYSHVVWFLTHGAWPHEDNQVHHLNNDPIDNRPDNLSEEDILRHQRRRRGRIVSRAYGKGKYGYGMGIYADKRDGRFYVSRSMSRGHGDGDLKTISIALGGYGSLDEAEAAVTSYIAEIKENGLNYMPDAPEANEKRRTIELQEHRNSIRRRRAAGETLAQIAKATGLSESSVYGLVKDMRIDKRKGKTVGYKLTPDDVRSIRQEYTNGATLAALGRKYNVTGEMIGDIIHGRAWVHVK